jgi:hypothetical protein
MKKICIVLVLAMLMVLQFCSSSKKSQSAMVTPKITYMANVQPTIAGNCTPCHFPPKGTKKPFDNYDSVKSSIDDIIIRIQMQPGEKGFMPFKHPRLPDSTILVFVNWKKDGLAEQ